MDTLWEMKEMVIVSSVAMGGVDGYFVGGDGGGDHLISNNGWSGWILCRR